MFNLTMVRTDHGDDEMHVAGCADIKRTAARRKAWHGEEIKGEYTGATLVDAIVAADTDMAGWFGEEPYTESSRENGCWATASVKWAPCFKTLMRKERVTLNSEDGTYRPVVKETKVTRRATYKDGVAAEKVLKAQQADAKASKVSKAERVRQALRAGATLVEVANDGDLGVTYAYAWDIKKAMEVKAFADQWSDETGEKCDLVTARILMDKEADVRNGGTGE